MELSEIIPHIEALIFASDRPLTSLELVDLINNAFGFMEQQINLDQVETALEGIREKYNADFYPFEVFQSGGGWQFLSKPAFHTTIAQLNGGKFLKKLSNAALETLSIIAYKQPITKGEIESIRGVNSDYSVQKLLEKELIIISGRNEEMPGKPLIYETSKSFMDYFGLNSASDLPKIKEVLAEQFEPTLQQRNTEENADFGIFNKFDDNKADTTADSASTLETEIETASESEGSPSADLEAESEGTTDEALELELSDEENRESLQEATAEMDQQLHPDLSGMDVAASSLVHTTDTEDNLEAIEPTAEVEQNDIADEELADLEEDAYEQDETDIDIEEDEEEEDENEEDEEEVEEEEEDDDEDDEEEDEEEEEEEEEDDDEEEEEEEDEEEEDEEEDKVDDDDEEEEEEDDEDEDDSSRH